MACLQPRNTESKFTLCTNFHVSISVDSISPPLPIPALLTNMFRDPALFLIYSIADIQSSDLVTSKLMPWQDSSLHVFFNSLSLISLINTTAPSSIIELAISLPKPWAAPVMSATFPFSLSVIINI